MQNKVTSARQLLTTSVANLLNPPTVTGGVNGGSSPCVIFLKQLLIVNLTTATQTCSFWIGATGASASGTEFLGSTMTIPANTTAGAGIIINTNQRLESTQFLTGSAGANSSITVDMLFEIGVA